MTRVVFLDAGTLPQGLAFDPVAGIDYSPYESAAESGPGPELIDTLGARTFLATGAVEVF